MIEQLKLYANAIITVCLLAGLTYTHIKAYDAGKGAVQAKFDDYKRNIHEQVQKAADAAAIEKQQQDRLYADSQKGYSDTAHNLDIALKRLRDLKTLPREGSVPVAGTGSGTVPTQTENTTRATDSASFGAGTFQSVGEFYEAALKDTLQCSKLIEFVSP